MARLGLLMNHLTEFRDPDARFESFETYVKLEDKFGGLKCNLLIKQTVCTYAAACFGSVAMCVRAPSIPSSITPPLTGRTLALPPPVLSTSSKERDRIGSVMGWLPLSCSSFGTSSVRAWQTGVLF